jgi:hypothetical protein
MRIKPTLLTIISLALIAVLAFNPSVAYAALGPFSVTPDHIVNNAPASITITGSGFDSSAIVLLDVYGVLDTTFLNNNVLTAIVPAGIPVGTYDVTVKTDTDTGTCSSCLTVSLPSLSRPQLVLDSYISSTDLIQVNKEFKLTVNYRNSGDLTAYNTQVVFTSPDLTPTQNGGIVTVGTVASGGTGYAEQYFVLHSANGKIKTTVDVTFTYYDTHGTLYSNKFTISLRIRGTGGGNGNGNSNNNGGGGGVASTSTPSPFNGPQLIISGYSTSVDPLQPGLQFKLSLTIKNVGNAKADRITMIVGGGSTGSGGTPSAGGVSGSGGSFGNFAPVGASNVQSLGALAAGSILQATQNLIVNVSTEPGAYPIVLTFSYLTDKGASVNDDQVITLLVYSLPNLDVSFYRPVDPFFVGQPGALPIQIVNLGKRSAVLGNVKVTTENGTLENGTSLVGALDPGGYYTLDAMLTPDQAGTLKLTITVDYTDDFNQARTVVKTLEVEVSESTDELGPGGPSGGGGDVVPVEETFFQKVWRFILGLFGLDSAPPGGDSSNGTPTPIPVPIRPGGKG